MSESLKEKLEKEKSDLLETHRSLEKELFFCETADHAQAINDAQEELIQKISKIDKQLKKMTEVNQCQ